MKNLRDYTGTSREADDLGVIIARILGFLDQRRLIGIEHKKGKPCDFSDYESDYKLIFRAKSWKVYSKYISKKILKKMIQEYYNGMFKFFDSKDVFADYSNICKVSKKKTNEHSSEDDLPF